MISTGICQCCLWQPGFDDDPAASGAPDTILEALRIHRHEWSLRLPAWSGKMMIAPLDWDRRAQLERLFQFAPYIRLGVLAECRFLARITPSGL